MMNYKELFVIRFLDNDHYAAVIFDKDSKCFYHALFEGIQVGGACAYVLKDKRALLTIEQVRKSANASEDGKSHKYVDITEDNWRELIEQ